MAEAEGGLEYVWAVELVADLQAASPSLAARFVAEAPSFLGAVRAMEEEEFGVVMAAIQHSLSMTATTPENTPTV